MIPAYKEDVKITIVEQTHQANDLEQKVRQLEERVRNCMKLCSTWNVNVQD